MRGAARAAVLAAFALLAGAAPAAAQALAPGVPQSPILTLDQDRLFADSRFGRRVMAEIEAAQAALVAENRRIEAELEAEERDLTERRAALDADAFRALAEAFDARVQAHRAAQDTKARDLSGRRDGERQRFYALAVPELAALMREAGAVAILSDEAIVLTFDSIDITAAAIARMDDRHGDGQAGNAVPGEPAPGPGTDPPADPAPAPEPPPAAGND
jgi:Skp family chaperone for outer membrane proteins